MAGSLLVSSLFRVSELSLVCPATDPSLLVILGWIFSSLLQVPESPTIPHAEPFVPERELRVTARTTPPVGIGGAHHTLSPSFMTSREMWSRYDTVTCCEELPRLDTEETR